MPAGAAIDRPALHRYLWRHANHRHLVTVRQYELAEQLGCAKWTMSKVLAKLVAEGRIRVVSRAKLGIATYAVADPDTFE